jgi:hypothetical protein
MDFDQMLETWHGQDTAPLSDVKRDAHRQALQIEEARVRREVRNGRRGLWIGGILVSGMAIWAGFWIAITIANEWPVIYGIAAAASFGMFALGAGAVWVSHGRDPERNFGNTLEEEVRRNLALVDYELSIATRWITLMLGMASICIGAMLMCWTVIRSQKIPDSTGGSWTWGALLIGGWCLWGSYKAFDEMRKSKPKLELRHRRLRELIAALDAHE